MKTLPQATSIDQRVDWAAFLTGWAVWLRGLAYLTLGGVLLVPVTLTAGWEPSAVPTALSSELAAEIERADAPRLHKWVCAKLAIDFARCTSVEQFMADRSRVQLVLLHRFMEAFPENELATLVSTPRGRRFLGELICEDNAVKGIWAAVPSAGSVRAWAPGTLDVWVDVWFKQGPLERRKYALLGAACASALGGKGIQDYAGKQVDPWETYGWFRRLAEQRSLLIPMEKLNYDETVLLVWSRRSLAEMDYLRKTTKPTSARWSSVADNCWRVKYTRINKEGVSVHSPNFYGGQIPTVDVLERQGGVCGAISKFGVATCRAFGVPATAVGQPGHCAFIWLAPDFKWQIGNNVHGWSKTFAAGEGIGGTKTLNPWGVHGEWLRVVERLRAAPVPAQKAELLMAAAGCFGGASRQRLLEQAVAECDFHPSPWILLIKDAEPSARSKLLEKAKLKLKGYPACVLEALGSL